VPKIERPTWVVFDLDPGEGADVLTCARVAVMLRELLKQLTLESFVKVSGSKGLQLYVPIFGGNQLLQNRTTFVQQKVNYKNTQLISSGLEIQVKSDVLRAYQNFKLYKKTFAVSIDQLKAADIAFGFEKERYDLGITSFVDYIQANKTLVQAQTDRAQAEYRLLFQKVLLDYAIGTLKPEDLE